MPPSSAIAATATRRSSIVAGTPIGTVFFPSRTMTNDPPSKAGGIDSFWISLIA
jgi:hypothetical protein